MLDNYIPVLIFLAIATGIGLLLLALGFLFGSGQKDEEKLAESRFAKMMTNLN